MDKSLNNDLIGKLESYYRIPTIPDNDFCVTEYPLQINCTGYSQYECIVHGDSIRNDFYCIYLTKGRIKVDNPFSKTMQAGDFVVFSPQVPYDYTGLNPYSYHWIHFTGSGAEQLLNLCKIPINQPCTVGISEEALIAKQRIVNEFKNREMFWENQAVSELIKFFVAIGKSINFDSKKKKEESQMEKAAAYIQSNISKPISVSRLADKCCMSVSGFRSTFKAYAGMSPKDYINTIRLREAMRLLVITDTSIENIALICGYGDPMYFSRFFKSKTGQSPREYRKNSNK